MAKVGGPYVSLVSYTVNPVSGTSKTDLTSEEGNGVTFPLIPNTVGVLDENKNSLYQITITFNREGVDSLSSIVINKESNVNEFSVEFFNTPDTSKPFTISPNTPLVYKSTLNNNEISITNFRQDVPSPLFAVRINILSTAGNQ